LYCIAGGLKIDSLVTGSAYLGIVLLTQEGGKGIWQSRWQILGLAVLPIVGYLSLKWDSHFLNGNLLAPMDAHASLGSTSPWSGIFGTYPILPFYFLHPTRIVMVLQAYGVVWIPLAIALTVFILYRDSRRFWKPVAFGLLWCIPLFSFWVSHEAINAREFLCTAPGLALLLALPLQCVPRRILIPIFVAAWSINAAWIRPTSQTFFPSARLFKSSLMYQDYHRKVRLSARLWLENPAPRKILLGDELTPCYQGYAFVPKRKAIRLPLPGAYASYRIFTEEGGETDIAFHYGPASATWVKSLQNKGYQVSAAPDYRGPEQDENPGGLLKLPDITSYGDERVNAGSL
jgi:hypothetical protein